MNYLRKPYEVVAFQHDGSLESAQRFSAWIHDKNESAWYMQPLGEELYNVHVSTDAGTDVVGPGDWLVFNDTGIARFVSYTAEQFAECFESVAGA